jgi:uncharacterized protein
MRILIDTNVWVSALLWPDSLPNRVLQVVIRDHTVILSTGIMDELRDVYGRKFPHRLPDLEDFFSQLSYVMAPEPSALAKSIAQVLRDPNDLHVLASAVAAQADVLLTGDQDFAELSLTKPLILTPRQFAARHPEYS